jgi:hypothetical protein
LVARVPGRVVLGPFGDGRSGYVFAVNPTGARYDSIVSPGGESDNPDWDGIWEAATARLPTGWSAEIRIPVLTIAFKPGLHEWHFNVQRRIQRRLETDRLASPNRQYQITQTSRAGLLTGLPDFDLGVGLTVRPAVTSGGGIPSPDARVWATFNRVSTSTNGSARTSWRPRRSTRTSRRQKSIHVERT